jgi:polyphosphate:AMP phosphotransferase
MPMFEAAETGSTVSKEDYKARAPRLRTELLEVQRELTHQARFPVIIVFAGVDGGGKSESVNLLNAWMDPRWIVTRAFGAPSEEERSRPEYWRYWLGLPPGGRVGLFLSSWYSSPVLDRVHGRIKAKRFNEQLADIAAFEKTLADDGALILKFWMHLGRRAQKERLEHLEGDPLTRWRVTKRQWKHWRMYADFVAAGEHAIGRTSTPDAPWTIVDGTDERFRSLTVATGIRDAVRTRLADGGGAVRSRPARSPVQTPSRGTILGRLNMSRKMDREAFGRAVEQWQGRLNILQRKAHDKGVAMVLAFEGWDAAGKGGAIRRVTAALEAPMYRVIPIAAPNDEERAHHYLWRFWRQVPRGGKVAIFDRSWYGRVLVERVEGLASPSEWRRAYSEINHFEEQLAGHGVVLVKYWLHITPDEQLRRFKERQQLAFKRWKLTADDWRNRKQWDKYALAVNEMIERTSTAPAPWTIVEANDKFFARIKVLKTACNRLEEAIG